ncbi:signal peptidase I [Engelhardtia mirabilis]|uniref:Signal peptidase I n=1 Tax=Engelhardtia mirabilis TaxID=2528011 RepID=A0A518BKV8_9BACT|nr:Signal peptidase IB [Planctomycetes bacterium Pla133]QDV01928.1 Signal peptidase IB [Planctomycetes bacterium Pla86]
MVRAWRSRPIPRLLLSRRARSLRDGLFVSVAGMLAYTLLFNLSVVRGASMQPGIHDGDRILVEPWSFVFGHVNRGDIVVLRSPVDPQLDYIKRVVGLPGERVVVGPAGVFVDGSRLEEPYAVTDRDDRVVSTVVDPGHVFVMGDNRPHSADSRDFGLVPVQDLRGRVELRVWPPARIGILD